MPKVPPPVMHEDHFREIAQRGVIDLVDGWDLEHGGQYGIPGEAFVLSIWSQNRDKQPLRVCLSPPAVAQIAEGFAEKLDEYLLGSGTETAADER